MKVMADKMEKTIAAMEEKNPGFKVVFTNLQGREFDDAEMAEAIRKSERINLCDLYAEYRSEGWGGEN